MNLSIGLRPTVPERGSRPTPLRAETDAPGPREVAVEGAQMFPGGDVPQSHAPISAASGGGEPATVRAKDNAGDFGRMSLQGRHVPATVGVP